MRVLMNQFYSSFDFDFHYVTLRNHAKTHMTRALYETLCALVHNLQYARVIYREENRYEFSSSKARQNDIMTLVTVVRSTKRTTF